MNGMILEDDAEIKGTKISWVIENDLRGSVPRSIINMKAVNHPKKSLECLAVAC